MELTEATPTLCCHVVFLASFKVVLGRFNHNCLLSAASRSPGGLKSSPIPAGHLAGVLTGTARNLREPQLVRRAITGFTASPLRRITGFYFTLQATRGSVMEEAKGGHFAICASLSFICGLREKPPSIRDFSSRRSHCDRSTPLRSEFLF